MGRDVIEHLLRAQESGRGVLNEAEAKIFSCPVCGMYAMGPPHGWGEPCPTKSRESEAYVSHYEASRMAAVKQGVFTQDMVEMLKKLTGYEEDE